MQFSPESFANLVRSLEAEVRSASPSQLHDEVGEAFREAQAGNFERSENESGVQWPPRTRKYAWPILRKTRKMLGAASRLGAEGNIHRSAAGRLTLGISNSDVPYAKYHQYGTIRLPIRRFLYVRQADKPGIKRPIKSHLMVIFNRTKGRYRAS